MTDDIAAWLTAIWDEQEWWASEASRDRNGHTPTGEHWQWECSNDHVVTPQPLTDEALECPECESSVSLRSVEAYPTTSVGLLPNFAIHTAEDISSTVAGHIIRHDPAAVLARIEADRQILRLHSPNQPAAKQWCDTDQLTWPCRTVRLLALPHATRPGYREEWRP